MIDRDPTNTPADGGEGTSLRPAICELERAFRAFCVSPFKRQKPLPVIAILPKGRRRALGWFWAGRWQDGRERAFPEINVCAEHLVRPAEDIAELLLHEMCHYANWIDGVRDCTSSQYHNRAFKDRCDSIGLLCEKGKRGWAWTSLSPQLLGIVREVGLDPAAFELNRGKPALLARGVPQAEQRLRRYLCACPRPRPIRASRGLDVTCNNCLQVYRESPLA